MKPLCQCGHERPLHYRTETMKWKGVRCHGVTPRPGHVADLCQCRGFVPPEVAATGSKVLTTLTMAILSPLVAILLAARVLEWLAHLVCQPILWVLKPAGLRWIFAIRGGVARKAVRP